MNTITHPIGRYIYAHHRASPHLPFGTEIFYIGKGSKNRAYHPDRKNEHWRATKAKYGYTVEILADNLTAAEQDAMEASLISQYRELDRQRGTHILTNHMAGGEGGGEHSEATRRKMSAQARQRYADPGFKARHTDTLRQLTQTAEWLAAVRAAAARSKHDPVAKANRQTVARALPSNPVWQGNHAAGITKRSQNQEWRRNNAEANRNRPRSVAEREINRQCKQAFWDDPVKAEAQREKNRANGQKLSEMAKNDPVHRKKLSDAATARMAARTPEQVANQVAKRRATMAAKKANKGLT